MKFRILATLAVLLLSAPSALGVQRALAPTRGDLAGWLAAAGIELAYLSLAFAAFVDQRRQRLAARVALMAVLTAITLNVIADYAARVPDGLSGAAQFHTTFDWLLLALSVLESAPLAGLAYTIARLLHSSAQHTPHTHPQADTHTSHTDTHTAHTVPHPHPQPDTHTSHTVPQADTHTAHTDPQADTHTTHTDPQADKPYSHTVPHTTHTDPQADTHPQADTSHTPQSHPHPDQQQRAASYRCPHCGAVLEKQQQYAAALRYGHCARCKQQC